MMLNLNNNKWLAETPLSKNKEQRYYYDFGTEKKVEREEVKKEKDAILNNVTATVTKSENQKKDNFLEGFNNPYGEKREQEPQQKEPNRKEKFAEIRANADNRTWSSQNDPFLEGFNGNLNKRQPEFKPFPLASLGEIKTQNFPGNPNKPLIVEQYAVKEAKDPWSSSLCGDLNSNNDKELFLKGFAGENKQTQSVPSSPDAIEFGEDSETYKILQDLSKRWYAASDFAEKDRLHKVAEDVRMYHRQGTPIFDKHDAIMNLLHENKKRAQNYQRTMTEGFPGFLYRMSDGNYMLDSSTYLIGMVNKGEWDYKYNEDWQVPYDNFGGKYMDTPGGNYRNWTPWMYFDGRLISADKLGNMNMAYVGKNMGLPEWVYQNITTTDKDDAEWVQYGIDLANSGR